LTPKKQEKKSNNFSNTFDKIERCIQTWVDKKKLIIEAINFIDDRGGSEGLNTPKVEELIGYLIFSINSRMPKKCGDCREWYKAEIGKKPETSCNLCNTSLHGCNKKYYDMRMPGLAWLCYKCLDKLGKPENIFAIKIGLIIETTIKKDQSLNEVRNSETNNRKEEKMGENKVRRREKRDRENMEMDKIEVVEVSVEINGEEIQSDPQNEIITENVEILGDEQTKNTKKKEKSKE